jgi:putative DNA methylase
MSVGKCADYWNTIATWMTRGTVGHAFTRQAIPMTWDFAEANPLADFHCAWHEAYEWVASVCDTEAAAHGSRGTVLSASATALPLPDDSADALITDPPYYDAVPYAHLSDFFYVWHRRCIGDLHQDVLGMPTAPKEAEIVVDRPHELSKSTKTIAFYERELTKAFADSRRVLKPAGIGVIVFASKTTASWEAILQAVVDAGWRITGSWPIDTEREARMAAQGQARLASSVHLVCRPRENESGEVTRGDIGDWRSVLAELPGRIHEWMPRLAEEGVVGADAIFACLGPALEIFSRYSRVEKASGEVVTLREYLEQVWAAVSTEALSMIFRDADAAGLESDARFTAIVLWTLGAGVSSSSESSEDESEDAEQEDEEGESPKGKAAKGGYTLEYDAARKIAQGLGVNLEQIDSVVEVKGDKARLRPVGERATTLFGKAERAEAATKKRGKKATQKKLFDKNAEEGGGTADTVTIGEGVAATPGVTALDRVHQAMLLFAGGRADALKRFIVEDGVGGDARFWKLAQSLSALYPAGSDEKRWVDGVLARKKSFGF